MPQNNKDLTKLKDHLSQEENQMTFDEYQFQLSLYFQKRLNYKTEAKILLAILCILVLETMKYARDNFKFGNKKTPDHLEFNQDVLEFCILYNLFVYFYWVFKYSPCDDFKWFYPYANYLAILIFAILRILTIGLLGIWMLRVKFKMCHNFFAL